MPRAGNRLPGIFLRAFPKIKNPAKVYMSQLEETYEKNEFNSQPVNPRC